MMTSWNKASNQSWQVPEVFGWVRFQGNRVAISHQLQVRMSSATCFTKENDRLQLMCSSWIFYLHPKTKKQAYLLSGFLIAYIFRRCLYNVTHMTQIMYWTICFIHRDWLLFIIFTKPFIPITHTLATF